MDGGGAAPEADGHRLRRMPRHAQQGKEFRRFRGYHGPPDDPILFYCQRAHFGGGALRSHELQYSHRTQEVPRAKQ